MSDMPTPVALRTYTAIRMGVVAVIVALGIAVWREMANSPDDCVQRSLSAYYYTPVRPVFVGALLIIGFAMIVMWGMTPWEDAALNLAGLLLMVVALVPTLDANYCSLPKAIRGQVPDTETKQIADDALISANAEAVSRSFTALLFVVALVLLFVAVAAVAGVIAGPRRRPATDQAGSRCLRGHLGAGCRGCGHLLRCCTRTPTTLTAPSTTRCTAGRQTSRSASSFWLWCLRRSRRLGATTRPRRGGCRFYGVRCCGDGAGRGRHPRVVTSFDLFSGWVDDHATFLLEAILIGLLGVFWTLQTIDRRGKGAPTY